MRNDQTEHPSHINVFPTTRLRLYERNCPLAGCREPYRFPTLVDRDITGAATASGIKQNASLERNLQTLPRCGPSSHFRSGWFRPHGKTGPGARSVRFGTSEALRGLGKHHKPIGHIYIHRPWFGRIVFALALRLSPLTARTRVWLPASPSRRPSV